MHAIEIDNNALAGLRDRLAGTVIVPDDAGYDDARAVFNSMIDRRPRVISQCSTTVDVVSAIAFGREHDLEIAVRGGGHGVAGAAVADNGIVVDLRPMNDVIVDPDARTVQVGGGATAGDLDRATQPYGMVTTAGRVSTTGMGGFTLGGGSGWLERKFGLACDNLISVRLVTAAGDVLVASEDENPELFWALHGGGGNFGVATSFTFRLHPLPSFTAALFVWPPQDGPRVARAYRELMDSAPDEAGGGLIYLTAPPEPFVPEHLVGHLAAAILVTYAGPEAAAREFVAPMARLDPAGQMIAELPYAQLQSMLDDPPGFRNYWSAEYLESIPDPALDVFCSRAHDMVIPSPSLHVMFPQGGAVARGPADYPVPWRSAPWAIHPQGMWQDPADDQRGRQWVKSARADMQPWSTGSVYLNFIGGEGEDRIVAGFGQQNYQRLASVKAHYDPRNTFHLNHNIRPG